jgi:RNA polymerase sigma factor (sigma-70 family)
VSNSVPCSPPDKIKPRKGHFCFRKKRWQQIYHHKQHLTDTGSYHSSEIIPLFRAGDEQAFKVLYNMFYAGLYRFSESLINNDAQSQDIVITAFTHLWNRRDGFTDINSTKGFLYITVKNACLKYFRDTKNSHKYPLTDDNIFDNHFADTRIIEAEVIRHLYDQVKSLPAKYQEIIQLLFVEGKTIAEAADVLRITQENVRKRKERALAELRIKVIKESVYPLLLLTMLEGKIIPGIA